MHDSPVGTTCALYVQTLHVGLLTSMQCPQHNDLFGVSDFAETQWLACAALSRWMQPPIHTSPLLHGPQTPPYLRFPIIWWLRGDLGSVSHMSLASIPIFFCQGQCCTDSKGISEKLSCVLLEICIQTVKRNCNCDIKHHPRIMCFGTQPASGPPIIFIGTISKK